MAVGVEIREHRSGKRSYRAVCWDPVRRVQVRETFATMAEARAWRKATSVALNTAQHTWPPKRCAVPARVPKAGITYAISSKPFDGWVKIGRTSGEDPRSRIAALQTGNPRELIVRSFLLIDIETELHRAYAGLRGVGEWFALPLEFMRDMASVRDMPDPLTALLDRWPVGRVHAEAGGWKAARSPRAMARKFATKAASA